MSGASALAAAKRRRSKLDSSRATTSSSNNTRSGNTTSNSGNSGNMPQRLNVQQSFQYMWQKIIQLESMINNNTTIMNNKSSPNNDFEVNDLRQKINLLENSIKQVSSNTSSNTVEVNGEKYVSIEQFNEVMSKVATDMQGITEKVAQLSDFVSNVQNNNVVLRNILDSMESQNFGFDGSNSVGLSIGSNENSSMNEESVEESIEESIEDVGNDVNGEDTVDDTVDDTINETGDDVSATPDVTSVLEKLKTLNSEDIKQEVAAELNNNITLVVEENSNSSPSESTN